MNEWISVKDRLPDYGEIVWVVWEGVVQKIAYARDQEYGVNVWVTALDIDCDSMPHDQVTHWMPQPEPPK